MWMAGIVRIVDLARPAGGVGNIPLAGRQHARAPIGVELPAAVELTITETAPQPKGATATNQLKEATVETGARIRVPPFIENGQVVKINTETGEYLKSGGSVFCMKLAHWAPRS